MNTISSRLRQYPRLLPVILTLGLVLRLAFVLAYNRPLISDEKDYDKLGFSLSSSGTYAVDGAATAYRRIGYPMVVGLAYLVFGHEPLVVKCGQALVDTATAFFIFLLLAGYPNRVRLTGVALWVFFIPSILYTRFLMSECLFTFVLLTSVLLLAENWETRLGPGAVLGVLFGFLVLMKPGLVLFLIALTFFYRRLGFHPKTALAFLLAFVVVVGPWLWRNYSTFGVASPSSNGGINLLIGNNPHATGAYGTTYDSTILQDARNEFDADQKAFRHATKYILENPGTFLINGAKKIGRLFESEGGLLVWSFHRDPEDVSSRYAAKYASIPLGLTLLTNLPYFFLLLTGIFGFLGSPRDRFWKLTAILLASWILLHAVFFGGGRFHFPLMPFAVVFATIFLASARDLYARLSNFKKIVGVLVSLLLLTLWTIEGISVYSA